MLLVKLIVLRWILVVSVAGIPVQTYDFASHRACKKAVKILKAEDPTYDYKCKGR